MPQPLSQQFLKKAHEVMMCAMETYNRPTFMYRDETFTILAINAWELLLKARIIAGNGETLDCLYVLDPKTKTFKKNRSGTPLSIEIRGALKATNVPASVSGNIEALAAIRDNSIHLMNMTTDLSQRIYSLSAACVSNFLELAREWFGKPWNDEGLYLLPLGFPKFSDLGVSKMAGDDHATLIAHLDSLIANQAEAAGPYSVALRIQISFVKAKLTADADLNVRITNDPSAPAIRLTDEQVRQRWPLDYTEVGKRLKATYPQLLLNDLPATPAK
jgi:hypothetical protein